MDFIFRLRIRFVLTISIIFLLFTSCKKDSNDPVGPIDEVQPIEELEIPDNFSYSTIKAVTFRIGVETSNGTALPGALVQIFLDGFTDDGENTAFISGVTADNGIFTVETVIPVTVSEVYILSSMIGGLNRIAISTAGGQVQHTFRPVRDGGRVVGKGSGNQQIDLVHFEDPIITDANMSIIIQEISGIEVSVGAELACVTPDGLVAGLVDLNESDNGQWGMAVWANDAASDTIDGFRSGEELAFIFWDPLSQTELSTDVTQHLGGELVFRVNSLLVIRLHVDAPDSRIRYLGGWTENGVPDYLSDADEAFTNDFLRSISIALPENSNISSTYNDFIVESGDIQLSDDAEISLSFLHEGTENSHTFGYYAYPTDNPPQSAADIEYFTIIFPNCSFADIEAGLSLGNQVQLGEFSAGTSLGWFIFKDGWVESSVNEEADMYFSNSNLNVVAGLSYRHSILFHDSVNGRVLLGFEDRARSWEFDVDFNDLLFSINASPANAISLNSVPEWNQNDSPPDADNDGISDAIDEFPDTRNLAFSNKFPSPSTHGTIAFENNWPEAGDYDFNDLVVTYDFKLQTNSEGMVSRINAVFNINAIGTESRDGFGFILPIDPGLVSQVTGSILDAGYLNMTGSNLEAGHGEAAVIVIDDALSLGRPAGGYNFVNTEQGSPEVGLVTINIQIEFNDPVSFNDLGAPPYSPFLIVNGDRDYEIHASDMPGSDLMNNELYGQGRDNSDPNTGRYYKSDVNLPWALIMSGEWRHPIEGTPINAAYTIFEAWAESGGATGLGWFLPIGGNIAEGMVWIGE